MSPWGESMPDAPLRAVLPHPARAADGAHPGTRRGVLSQPIMIDAGGPSRWRASPFLPAAGDHRARGPPTTARQLSHTG